MLSGAKDGTLGYGDLQGESVEQKRKETIEYCEQELKDVRADGIGSISYSVHLDLLPYGGIAYNMYYNEVLYIKNSILKAFSKITQPEKVELKVKPALSIRQIALKYVYNGNVQVTRANCDEIIKEYGHNSGDRLYNLFTEYSSTTNRRGVPKDPTLSRINNKIKLLESVVSLVLSDKQGRVIDEINILKNTRNSEYL